ncbi:MAG TPA: 4-hydroxy-tetrahydrodipicolinate synthase [Thermotogota bacterium]|nr:4-hydroxy-tetrahydrodipicolinate synthase [Thermotogota bacterium]
MFRGTGTAIITPMKRIDKSIEVDYEALGRFCEFQIENNTDAIIVLGTTGEAPVFCEDERDRIIRTVVETVNGRVPVIAGTGTNNTEKCIDWSLKAEKLGADGLLIVTPYYNKSSQEGLYRHFRTIDEHTGLPSILYNVPSRTGMNLLPETAIRIYKNSRHVCGIKEASGNISQIAELSSLKPEGLMLYSGNDDQVIPLISLGGDGVVSVFSNVFPKEMHELTRYALNGDFEAARGIQNRYLKFIGLLFKDVNPIPVKYAVSQLGWCENLLRLPLIEASEDLQRLIGKELERLGDVA